ncbi:hypothetical protein NDU88_004530 [Pleurodeles waltl]|uniref:Uncharacterized protein n=1 Tax=Pleurodeles waltl TaxID=8319 RepID=A0AAV7RJV8_PLEWA|nr:hypothetical protein NDU88_004530 [Pleurodeles waltl]
MPDYSKHVQQAGRGVWKRMWMWPNSHESTSAGLGEGGVAQCNFTMRVATSVVELKGNGCAMSESSSLACTLPHKYQTGRLASMASASKKLWRAWLRCDTVALRMALPEACGASAPPPATNVRRLEPVGASHEPIPR